MSYFDCALIPVPTAKLAAYKSFSEQMARISLEYGVLRQVDCVLDPDAGNGAKFHAEEARDLLQGVKLRDFPMAAAAQDGETVILSWTEWPSKEARDQGLPRLLADPRVQPQDGQETLFEGRRLIAGGFLKLVDVQGSPVRV
jgi:uncharacterized protein YbaA (DUF1428 family)